MAKRLLVLILMGTGLALAVQGANKRTTQGDYVYLQNGSGIRISIETYRAKAGWTPVIVSMAGAEVSAVMDSKGRVVQEPAKRLNKPGISLFTIELEKGRIMLGREVHAVRVFEQNNVRTRFEIAESVIQLPVKMDQPGKNGKLRFGNLEIPAQMSEADRSSVQPFVKLEGGKTSAAGVRPAGLVSIRPSGSAAMHPAARGFGMKAQLSPSHLRLRGK